MRKMAAILIVNTCKMVQEMLEQGKEVLSYHKGFPREFEFLKCQWSSEVPRYQQVLRKKKIKILILNWSIINWLLRKGTLAKYIFTCIRGRDKLEQDILKWHFLVMILLSILKNLLKLNAGQHFQLVLFKKIISEFFREHF